MPPRKLAEFIKDPLKLMITAKKNLHTVLGLMMTDLHDEVRTDEAVEDKMLLQLEPVVPDDLALLHKHIRTKI